MPKWAPANNDVPTVAEWVAYVADQVISQLTSGTRPAGTFGELIHQSDDGQYVAYNGSSWLPFGGLTSWPIWSPTLTQSAAVSYTANLNRYRQIGDIVFFVADLAVTSTGVANNIITISLPVTAVNTAAAGGTGYVRDASAGGALVAGIAHMQSTTTVALLDATVSTATLRHGQTGAAFAAALASGDSVKITGFYEKA